MRHILFLLLLFVQVQAFCQKSPVYATLTISNPSHFARQEVVAIPWQALQTAAKDIDTSLFMVQAGKQLLRHQFETAGTGAIVNLLIQVQLPAAAKLNVQLLKSKAQPFAPLTYGRYVPERKDDFAWENDKIAFRVYGKALEATNENGYGMDVWVKRTDSLIINQWYQKADYHKDHGQGLDYYSVGLSLGAGSIAPYVGDSLYYGGNYIRWEMLDNGPLRTSFRLFYPPTNVQGREVNAVKTISLDAGSQMNKINVRYEYEGAGKMPLAIGIVQRGNDGVIMLDGEGGMLGYWEPTHPKHGTTGVGAIYLGGPVKAKMEKKHLLLFGIEKKELTYYAGASWDKAGLIKTGADWFNFLQSYKTRLQHPLTVLIDRMGTSTVNR